MTTIWQRLGLENKSREERADYWRTNNSTSWKACEAMYPKINFNEKYPELNQMYKEPVRETGILERKARTDEEIRKECRKICPEPRQTILSSLKKREIEQAYEKIYGKSWFGLFDFGKEKKIWMLKRLLNCTDLIELRKNWGIGLKIDQNLLPKFNKLEDYVKSYSGSRSYLERAESERRIKEHYSRNPGAFITGRAKWALQAA